MKKIQQPGTKRKRRDLHGSPKQLKYERLTIPIFFLYHSPWHHHTQYSWFIRSYFLILNSRNQTTQGHMKWNNLCIIKVQDGLGHGGGTNAAFGKSFERHLTSPLFWGTKEKFEMGTSKRLNNLRVGSRDSEKLEQREEEAFSGHR